MGVESTYWGKAEVLEEGELGSELGSTALRLSEPHL